MQLTRPMEAATALGPTEAQRDAWRDADHAARPARLERLRERLASEGIDAYFGVRPENSRYLTGFTLGDGEEKVSGSSGRFLVSADETIVLADSRYRLQAEEQCPTTRVEPVSGDVEVRWRELIGGLRPIAGGSSGGRVTRVAVEAAFVSHAVWSRLADADPGVELVPVIGWVEALRAVKEPAELERIEAACGVADAALTATLADIRPGVSEQELALALEWRIRTGGAEALAFDVACLSGPRAALPHGSPGSRAIVAGEVLLFDFGAQVAGYRSDMTRTLFVGEPSTRDLSLHELVASAQRAAIAALEAALAEGRPAIDREIDQVARAVIEAAGHGDHFGHGLGHGIGLATHELPSLGRSGGAVLPSPTVFSVEPGVYLDGVTGVRIEDLVAFDAEAATLRTLTRFPRGVTVVGV